MTLQSFCKIEPFYMETCTLLNSPKQTRVHLQLGCTCFTLTQVHLCRCRIIFGPPSLKVRPDQILYKKRSGFYKKRSCPYKKRSAYKKRSGVEKCCIFNLKMNLKWIRYNLYLYNIKCYWKDYTFHCSVCFWLCNLSCILVYI